MSKAIICDRCGKPATTLATDENYVKTEDDLSVVVCGNVIAKFSDLCDDCSDEIIESLSDILGDAFENIEDEVEEEPQEGEEVVGDITDFPKDFIENVEGFDEEVFEDAVSQSLASMRDTKEYKQAAEEIGENVVPEDLLGALV